MAQYARPDSDVSTGSWTTTPLYSDLNETTPSDSEYVTSGKNAANDIFEVGLDNVTDPSIHTGHVVRTRIGGTKASNANFIISLYQSTTLIASWTHNATPIGFTTYNDSVSEAQAANITDYSALQVRVDGSASANGYAQCSWIEVEVPTATTTYSKTISAKGRIQQTEAQTVTAKAKTSHWYDTAWPYRVLVKINASEVDADLTDFPAYVDLNDLPAGFHSHVNQTDARDIRVTKDNGTTELPREVVFYNSATDTGELHLKYTGTLSGTNDTYVYIYYGNTLATDYARSATYGLENVWKTDYLAVYHLHETANTDTSGYKDSTSNTKHGTGVNMSESEVQGKLSGNAASFNGSSDRIGLPYLVTNNTFSITAWMRLDSFNANQGAPIYYQGPGNNSYGSVNFGSVDEYPSAGDQNLWVRSGGTTLATGDDQDYVIDTWYHWGVTLNNTAATFYFDGGSAGSGSVNGTSYPDTGGALGVWNDYTAAGQHTDGKIDEVRIIDSVLPSTWISTEHSNLSAPGTFYDVGSEEEAELITWQKTVSAKASIKQFAVEKTVTAKGRIQHTEDKTISAKADISSAIQTYTKTIDALGRIEQTESETIQAKGCIEKEGQVWVTAKGDIKQLAVSQTVTAKGRIQQLETVTIDAKGRIEVTIDQTVQAKGRIEQTETKTIQALGRVEKEGQVFVTAKADIFKTQDQTVTAKGRIQHTKSNTISAKARVQQLETKTVEAKANIFGETTQTIQAKAKVVMTEEQTIQAMAELHMFVEKVDDTTYKDVALTTANWDTAASKIHLT